MCQASASVADAIFGIGILICAADEVSTLITQVWGPPWHRRTATDMWGLCINGYTYGSLHYVVDVNAGPVVNLPLAHTQLRESVNGLSFLAFLPRYTHYSQRQHDAGVGTQGPDVMAVSGMPCQLPFGGALRESFAKSPES